MLNNRGTKNFFMGTSIALSPSGFRVYKESVETFAILTEGCGNALIPIATILHTLRVYEYCAIRAIDIIQRVRSVDAYPNQMKTTTFSVRIPRKHFRKICVLMSLLYKCTKF